AVPRSRPVLPAAAGQPSRQGLKDAADAALVQPGADGDLARQRPRPLEVEDFLVRRRAQLEQLLPQFVGLEEVARLRAGGGQDVVVAAGVQGLLALDRQASQADAG